MARRRRGESGRLRIRAKIAPEPMSVEDWQAAEALLARLAARAYLADNPQLLDAQPEQMSKEESRRDG